MKKIDTGKCRLVLDLRYVNQFLLTQKFKYDGSNLVPDLFLKGEYFFTFDLRHSRRLPTIPRFCLGSQGRTAFLHI